MSVWVLRRTKKKRHGRLVRVVAANKDGAGDCTAAFDTPPAGPNQKIVLKIAGVTAQDKVLALHTRRL